jgi:hypothetical protein
MRRWRPLFLKIVSIVLTLTAFGTAHGQAGTPANSKSETPATDPKLEQKAVALLEEVGAQATALKLPDNQVRVQLLVGDLLWDRNAGRARELFNAAGAMVAQLIVDVDRSNSELASGLRRELIMTVVHHDTELAFQLLSSTRPAPDDKRFNDADELRLEQSLLSVVAAKDSTAAYKKIMDFLDAGKYPSEIASLLQRLYSKDREAFEKLSKKLLSRLSTEDLIASEEAAGLAVQLLQPGPIPDGVNESTNDRALVESAYRELMEAASTAALMALPRAPGSPLSASRLVAFDTKISSNDRDGFFASGRIGLYVSAVTVAEPGEERYNNARLLLEKLRPLLPRIDQYLPDRASAIRQKLIEVGIRDDQEITINLDENTSDSLMAAAKSAPEGIRSEIYERAAEKALTEGNLDRALQIANEHLEATKRDATIRAIELKKMAINPSSEQLENIRRKVAALPTNTLRVAALIELAANAEKANPKLALKFLEDAAELVAKRARKYEDFGNQLRVAQAFSSLDPKRSFALLDSGIGQLNEILAAAVVVNGFEAEVFREEELPLQGNSELGKMVARYGWELGSFAKRDFDSARMSADKFQLSEARLFARLLMAKGLLSGSESKFNLMPYD